MDSTNKPYLVNNLYLFDLVNDLSLADKYRFMKRKYNAGDRFILFNNVNVFGPYPEPDVPWDISDAEKIAIYNPEVTVVLNWIKSNIIINLAEINYKTLDVLVRIATGMLNKCNIPKDIQIMFHDNMVGNLKTEHNKIMLSDLPF